MLSGAGFRSPSVLIENLFLGLVAACREHKVAGQKTQRPKHTVQNLQSGELTARLRPCFTQKCPLSTCKNGLHEHCFLSVFAQMQQ